MTETTEIPANAIRCLDHGFVSLVDYMGSDDAIVQAARVSYGAGTKKKSDDRGLIRYLMRHHHSTPFEMVEFKFVMKMPIFVARQFIRHRTANVNEYSARYSILSNEFYIPEPEYLAPQSKTNNQGRSEESLTAFEALQIQNKIDLHNALSYGLYEELLGTEDKPQLARELARMVLPVNGYTQWYWKCDLHNIFHMLKLRLDSHAQFEIRVYAEAIYKLIKDKVPLAVEAFDDYQLNAVMLSAMEFDLIRDLLHSPIKAEKIPDEKLKQLYRLSDREIREFRQKFKLERE